MKKNATNPLPISNGISILVEKNLLHCQENKNASLSLSPVQIQELERIKLGHELHDDVNANLAVAKLYVQIAAEKSEEGKKAIKLALSAIMSAMESIRRISSNMVVTQRKDFDLVNGTRQFLKTFMPAKIFKINCRFAKDFEKCGLTHNQQVCLYRIVQEQMNNIIKYSHAENVDINLACKQNICVLEIKDDGIGCNITARRTGIGLMNITNRVEYLNGKITIISSEGKGFQLRVTLPIA